MDTHRNDPAQGARSAPLGYSRNVHRTSRQLRLDARKTLWELSSLARVRKCGHDVIGSYVTVKTSNGNAGLGALETCGSVWACPVCATKVRSHRAKETKNALAHHFSNGGTAYFVTLTMRHRPNKDGIYDALADLWDDLSAAWNAAQSGDTWANGKQNIAVNPRNAERWQWLRSQGVDSLPGAKSLGHLGNVRFVEATHGKNGWHVHVHAIMFFDGTPDPAQVELLTLGMFDRWRHTLTSRGRFAPIADRGGLDLQKVDATEQAEALARYTADPDIDPEVLKDIANRLDRETKEKARKLSTEVTRSDIKNTRNANRTPWQILAFYASTGNKQDAAIWYEWENASKGRRFSTWSRPNNDPRWLALLQARGQELSDEEAATQDQEGDTLGYITRADWNALRHNTQAIDQILTLAVTRDTDGIAEVMADYGLCFYTGDPPLPY